MIDEYHEIVENLIPMHNSLRNPDKVSDFLKSKKVMTAKISIIDGEWYVHDGHHRVVAYLKDPSIPLILETKEFTLDDYLNPAPPIWLTPFNPITEVRLADFGDYKKIARHKSSEWMIVNRHLFAEPRKIKTMRELSDAY